MDKKEKQLYPNKSQIEKQIYRLMGKYLDNGPYFSNNKLVESIYFLFWKYFYKIKSTPLTVKYFFQRFFRGFDDLDKWNAAWYIARKSVPVLKAWRQSKMHGSSIVLHREDRFGNIIELSKDEIFTTNEEPNSFTIEEWQAILDDIIFAFQWQINFDSIDGTVSQEEYKQGINRQKRGLRLFSIYFNSLWD